MSDRPRWFTFNRTEKKGLIVFSIVIVLLFLLNMFVDDFIKPDHLIDKQKLHEWLAEIAERDSLEEIQSATSMHRHIAEKKKYLRFTFDPNTLPQDSLELLGFRTYQARNIVAYRKAGGSFIAAQGLYKIYGVDSSLVEELIPYVQISQKSEIAELKDAVTAFKREDINSVDSEALEKIRGIGEKRAETILKYRDLLGGFIDTVQYTEIYSLPDSLANALCRRFIIDSTKVQYIDLNKADFKQLIRHPYIDKQQVRDILKYREIKGEIKTIDEIYRNPSLNLGLNPLLLNYLKID